MKTVVYSCPFVPAEWIVAHGLRPRRILARPDGAVRASAGVCPYVAAFVRTVCSETDADATIVTTVCDQMRRASERIARESSLPLFLMNVPATWQTAAAHRLYLSELRRLGDATSEGKAYALPFPKHDRSVLLCLLIIRLRNSTTY